jgi:hypothetical protein
MNKELLDKLKFQAAAQVRPLLEGKDWQQEYSEKFAELIVRESMAVTKDYTCNQGWDYSAPVALARHFGVGQ